jgi:hypothetical protein
LLLDLTFIQQAMFDNLSLDLKIKYQFVTELDYNAIKDPGWPLYEDFVNHQAVPQLVYKDIDQMLSSQKSFDHPSFCVLPWHGREIQWDQHETHCCLLPKKYNIEKIKTDMKNGIRPSECQKCWNLEDQGLVSDRNLKNAALDFYSNVDIHKILDQAHDQVKMLKLITSYTCNGACVTCDSDSSSYWNTIERRIDKTIPIKKYSFIDTELTKSKIDFSHLNTLSLIGGEPLLEKNNFKILKELIDTKNTDIFISIVTNGSVSLNQDQQDLLSQFPNLNFCVSIDGKKSVFDYLRWPLLWSNTETNLKQYRSITNNISVSYTITNLNIMYHRDTAEWFRENNISWINNPVYEPDYFSPKTLPTATKHKLRDYLTKSEFDSFIGDPDADPGASWQEFLQQIHLQDTAKNIKIQDYLPEFCRLVGLT